MTFEEFHKLNAPYLNEEGIAEVWNELREELVAEDANDPDVQLRWRLTAATSAEVFPQYARGVQVSRNGRGVH